MLRSRLSPWWHFVSRPLMDNTLTRALAVRPPPVEADLYLAGPALRRWGGGDTATITAVLEQAQTILAAGAGVTQRVYIRCWGRRTPLRVVEAGDWPNPPAARPQGGAA